jgi:flagellin-like protein
MKKGITPVIATILLLLITIAIVGYSFGFFQKIFTTASSSGEQQASGTINQVGTSIRVENPQSTSVTIRNIGTTTITSTTMIVYVDNARANGLWDIASVAPGSVATFTYAGGPCNSGQIVKVSTTGITATDRC